MTLQEKYEHLTKGKRSRHDRLWVTNPALNELDKHWDNPVLIEISVKSWNARNQAYQKQGYIKFTPITAAPLPKEAKKAPAPRQPKAETSIEDADAVHTEE
jgi:hypothetical protein